jgi:hypothetical protein
MVILTVVLQCILLNPEWLPLYLEKRLERQLGEKSAYQPT